MLRIAIIGYGKMGHEIESIAIDRGHSVVLKIDNDNRADLSPSNLSKVDVAIEFTSPHTAKDNVAVCLDSGVPVVSGTTGWNDDVAKVIDRVKANGGTFFYASNYSVGVNIFFKINAMASKFLAKVGGYGVDIKEIHHTQKLDAPSGTAISIANAIADENPILNGWTLMPEHVDSKIPIEAIREGVVPGTHIVNFESEQDQIVLSHIAKSRRGFALGAVLAAEFIVGKKGFYNMDDLLNFE
ncbi:MAG: 4-hydroxy-tetrahydrodipicolinate reductase [Bacteroidales bacterium]